MQAMPRYKNKRRKEKMTGHNDITGDALISKATTKEYEEGWDRIFNKEPTLLESMETHDWVPGYGWVLKELRKEK